MASIPAAVSTPANYKVNRSRWIVWVGSKVAYDRVVGLFGSWVGLGGLAGTNYGEGVVPVLFL